MSQVLLRKNLFAHIVMQWLHSLLASFNAVTEKTELKIGKNG